MPASGGWPSTASCSRCGRSAALPLPPFPLAACSLTLALFSLQDPIHDAFRLGPACQLIFDTRQFQRLRRLKQLGLTYYVFPGVRLWVLPCCTCSCTPKPSHTCPCPARSVQRATMSHPLVPPHAGQPQPL